MVTAEAKIDMRELLEDPAHFCSMCWPDIELYDKQLEILYSVRDNRETFVHAGNELGKDFIAAIVAIWFFASRTPARVITTSSGERQLKSILWGEIKERLETSAYPFPFKVDTLEIKRYDEDGKLEPLSYIVGHVTKSVENFHGHHLPQDKPRVLGIFDEASGIGDEFYDAADSWAHRKLIIGNPMNTHNFFYRQCKKGDQEDPGGVDHLLQRVIHIGGVHSPNYRIGKKLKEEGVPGPYPTLIPGVVSYEDYVRRDVKWDTIKKTIRLHGHFYEGAEALLYPPDWLDGCERQWEYLQTQAIVRKAAAMGVDTGAGRDLSAWSIIDQWGIIKQIAKPTPDTTVISGLTIELMRRYGIRAERVAFDAGGGGKQIVDHLRALGREFKSIRSISFGGSATPSRRLKSWSMARLDATERQLVYKNRRAEMYGMLREAIDPSTNDRPFAIPERADLLRQELAIMPLLYDQEGKMFLPPKDRNPTSKQNDTITLRSILGRSPDRADSLVLANFAMMSNPKLRVGAFGGKGDG